MLTLNRLVASALVVGCVGVCSRAADAAPRASGLSPALAAAVADETGRLEGVVTDEGGRPLSGVAVTAQGSRLTYAVSDADGRFTFESLRPGPYIIRAQMPGFAASERALINVLPAASAWRSLRLRRLGASIEPTLGTSAARAVMTAGIAAPTATASEDTESVEPVETHDDSPTAWRLRHLKRSVLRETSRRDPIAADGLAPAEAEALGIDDAGQARLAAELWSGLPLSGEVQFLTTSSFNDRGDILANAATHGIAYVEVSAPAGRSATWSVQGAMTQGDLSSWVAGGSYTGRITRAHAVDAGVSYATQRYLGDYPLAFAAVKDGARTVGAMFVFDEWTLSRRATLTYGARYARYGYLEDPALLSPSLGLRWQVGTGTWLRGVVARQMLAPGAEEFVPSPVAGLWLPPQRTFSPLSRETGFRAERARHVELVFEREWASLQFSARGFREDVDDQIVTIFGMQLPGGPRSDLGHYHTASAGSLATYGWGIGISRPVASRLRGSIAYTVTHGAWQAPDADAALLTVWAPTSQRMSGERLHDVTTVVETDIPETATRVYAACRLNSGFVASSAEDDVAQFDTRFDVQVAQRLPFLGFTNAQWEVLFAVRNLFRDLETGSYYDELLVVRPPKRILGGLLVRF